MTRPIDEYRELVEALPAPAQAALDEGWDQALRVFSPRGVQHWLEGAARLQAMGRGDGLAAVYLREAPQLARELGEDLVPELVTQAMFMGSRTSGAVIELMLATAPLAAARLGDQDLFRGYLQFLNHLLAQAPRALRPLLENLGTLLGQLTLGGLRRWALWGAHAHKTDFPAQAAYFSLESRESQKVLQQERKGTLLVDVQRRLAIYLRALWGRDFFIRPVAADPDSPGTHRPYIEDYTLHLPDALDDVAGVPGLEVYRAAAAHGAAHLVHTRETMPPGLAPLERALVERVEDARVEALAARGLPGLAPLWARLHLATPGSGDGTAALLDRLARALADPAYRDEEPFVAKGRALFAAADLASNAASLAIGLELAADLGARGVDFQPRRDLPACPYRDDNRYSRDYQPLPEEAVPLPWRAPQVRKRVSLMEFVNEVEVEFAGDDAQEVWILGSELIDDDGSSWNEREGKPQLAAPVHYPEWDYQVQLARPAWATVLEKRARVGDPAAVDAIVTRHKPLVSRLSRLIEALQPQGLIRLRKQEDGDDIDLTAALDALVDLAMGRNPDPRVGLRRIRKVRDLSVLLLLDLSQSANDKARGSDQTVLELTREAATLMADALRKIGDPFAIHGFHSDGRGDVGYYRFKDFDAPWDDAAKARLAGMEAALSTRMGAALRHAGSWLARRPSAKKLLLVLTDGEPADVDCRDPQYLRLDAKRAVEELGRGGIASYCLSLDPLADAYVSRIFGANRYQVLDRVERLPEKLPMLYMGLTR